MSFLVLVLQENINLKFFEYKSWKIQNAANEIQNCKWHLFTYFFGSVWRARTWELMIISTQVWRKRRLLLLHNFARDGREEKWVSKQGFVLFTHIFTVIWCITANILWGNNPNWTPETRISAAWWLFYAVHVLIFFSQTRYGKQLGEKNNHNNKKKKSF